jgi:GT2 family glycosyltransferase
VPNRRPTDRTEITVVIATAGRPEELGRCLDAIANGTARPREIVVVDQSADDRSEAVVRERAGRGAAIRRVPQERLGLSASRNAGVSAASTSVVALTDDDCSPGEDWLAEISSAFSGTSPPQAVTGRVLPLGSDEGGYAVSSRTSTEAAEYRGRQLPWLVGTGANMAVHRDWWDRIGGFDDRLGVGTRGAAGEDLDFLHRLLRAGAVVRYEPQAVVYHERQTKARRRGTRSSYGRGVGACCSAWLRDGDVSGLVILGHWVGMRGRLLAGATRRRDWDRVEEELLVLRGTAGGLAYGARLRPNERDRAAM